MDSRVLFLESKKEWFITLGVIGIVFVAMLGWRFWNFQEYISQEKQKIQARVLNQYFKNDKWVLKLKAQNGMILYATSREDLKNLQNRDISMFGKPASCSFIQSLQSCFFVVFSFDLLPKDWRYGFYDFVSSQHQDPIFSQLYQALFFASALPKEWRDFASDLKISHLLAISGLHLGILAFLFYCVVSPIYRFFQARYFTYRNRFFDVGILLHLFLFGYLVLLDFPPSFVRAYVMSLMGYLFLLYYFHLVNFSFLALCAMVILALFPHFVFSLGFWFSVLGVFYIFLFFRHCSFGWICNLWLKRFVILCLLNLVLFFHMLIWTHLFFPSFSLDSWLAIPLSILFAPWFVSALCLHLLGWGGVWDQFLQMCLQFSSLKISVSTPLWLAIMYGSLSFGAIWSKRVYFVSLFVSGMFWLYLMYKIL
ncbi:ComEC/Rec2 family competence protein [Helicobacter kayseriensis]|uniref:ComEC/Rec2 family competence protein n=1 Tax=Helicobacter kayseriensis TaxID=2905877 RepID=UPI001E44FC25|nr:ComEC/Rec2 family competence protein [Helicobacter kayseriensis]MCE3047559.1 ComEC/Rec2 family competence protein [Helicobacter kayseriensis]MCE3048881.1 ComEC/Rec2 family competence protein [Helicobacter kayseriensis]